MKRSQKPGVPYENPNMKTLKKTSNRHCSEPEFRVKAREREPPALEFTLIEALNFVDEDSAKKMFQKM